MTKKPAPAARPAVRGKANPPPAPPARVGPLARAWSLLRDRIAPPPGPAPLPDVGDEFILGGPGGLRVVVQAVMTDADVSRITLVLADREHDHARWATTLDESQFRMSAAFGSLAPVAEAQRCGT